MPISPHQPIGKNQATQALSRLAELEQTGADAERAAIAILQQTDPDKCMFLQRLLTKHLQDSGAIGRANVEESTVAANGTPDPLDVEAKTDVIDLETSSGLNEEAEENTTEADEGGARQRRHRSKHHSRSCSHKRSRPHGNRSRKHREGEEEDERGCTTTEIEIKDIDL